MFVLLGGVQCVCCRLCWQELNSYKPFCCWQLVVAVFPLLFSFITHAYSKVPPSPPPPLEDTNKEKIAWCVCVCVICHSLSPLCMLRGISFCHWCVYQIRVSVSVIQNNTQQEQQIQNLLLRCNIQYTWCPWYSRNFDVVHLSSCWCLAGLE